MSSEAEYLARVFMNTSGSSGKTAKQMPCIIHRSRADS